MKKKNNHSFRIIGGKWRGRRFSYPKSNHLRATQDAVRETVFNWLAPYIHNRICLDMFAGSGAMSLEAMSRGASKAVLAEHNIEAIKSLNDNIQILGIENLTQIIQTAWPNNINRLETYKFDLIFLDPPFNQDWIPKCIDWIINAKCLNNNALIYVELESSDDLSWVPDNWEILKHKNRGAIQYLLIQT